MTENQRKLVLRHMIACTASPFREVIQRNRLEENPDDVWKEIAASFGFDIQTNPDKAILLLEDALSLENASDVEYALYLISLVDHQPAFTPILIKLLEAPWHHRHEDIVCTFQDLKAPETVEVLYATAFVEHKYLDYDENFGLARKCTWALADIGTAEAYKKLNLLAACDNPIIAAYAQKRIDR